MADAMRFVENYNGHDIKYIDFAHWYTVFTHKDDGTTAMHHFEEKDQAKEFIDDYEKEHALKSFWWDKN